MTLDDAKAMLARHNERSALELRCSCGRWYYAGLPADEPEAMLALMASNPERSFDDVKSAVLLLKQESPSV